MTIKAMIFLNEMDEGTAEQYISHVKKLYAAQSAAAYGWPEKQAIEYSTKTIDAELNNKNSKQYFYDIDSSEETVGALWFAIEKEFDASVAYLYMIKIDAMHQRKGYAKQALENLESLVLSRHGVKRIYLSVHAYNNRAFDIYRKFGFNALNTKMYKDIQPCAE